MDHTISEVTKKTGISAYTLRYYEKEGIMPFIKRNANGNRAYDDQSLEWINFVQCLRATGMPLSNIKRYLELYKKGDATIKDRKEIMRAHKAKVEKQLTLLHNCLEKINYKLALYDVMEKKLKTYP